MLREKTAQAGQAAQREHAALPAFNIRQHKTKNAMTKITAGLIIGATIGALTGHFGKCSGGA